MLHLLLAESVSTTLRWQRCIAVIVRYPFNWSLSQCVYVIAFKYEVISEVYLGTLYQVESLKIPLLSYRTPASWVYQSAIGQIFVNL